MLERFSVKTRHTAYMGLALLGALVVAAIIVADRLPASLTATTSTVGSADIIARGAYLATAGNCLSCHTREGGKPFAGGVPFETPLGTLYSTNITPDESTGIGQWSSGDFRRAMHRGTAPGGRRLFPAFPYTSFTKVTGEDIDAIYAYLRSIESVRYAPPANGFFFRQRWVLALWNPLFFKEGRFIADRTKSPEWNRGAYLVEGLGHCGACHTPRNAFMAEDPSRPLAGGQMQSAVAHRLVRGWSAVNLTSAKNGLASWTVKELSQYLQTGFSARAGTFGPMNEVIVNSTSKLLASDTLALATYLKSLPPLGEYAGPGVQAELISAGADVYKEHCSECHMDSGRGGMFDGPPLAGSAVVQSQDPASLINAILHGAFAPEEVTLGAWEEMGSFKEHLDNAQIAAVSNYVRGSWGNLAPAVTQEDVAQQR